MKRIKNIWNIFVIALSASRLARTGDVKSARQIMLGV